MASAARSAVLRQACITAPLKRSQPVVNLGIHPLRTSAFSTASSRSLQSTSRFVKPSFIQNAASKTARVAVFSTSSKRAILPPVPQRVEGTANDPAPVPEPHPTHGSYHWTFERVVSAALIPVTIAPFAGTAMYPVVDATLCALLMIHSHMGFQAIITDYIPDWRMPKIRNAFEWLLRLATLVVAVGLYEFETNDVGLTEAVRRIWTA